MMISKIKELLNPILKENRYYFNRLNSGFFLDKSQSEIFAKKGWLVISNVVSDLELSILEDALNELINEGIITLDENFLNSGCLPSNELKKRTREAIQRFVPSLFTRIFDSDIIEFNTGGSFVIKPPSKESSLQLHQDGSFVDEEKDCSMFMWIPFSNVDELNGCVKVLSGSHLWGNTQRGFGTKWNLEEHVELFKKHLESVSLNKGDILIFDPALIHGSEANYSNSVRAAITISVVKKNQQLIHYFKDHSSEKIRMYFVNNEYFDNEDFMMIPDENKWPFKEINYKDFKKSQKEIERLIQTFK
jgi:hypothetical protein